VVVSLLLSLRVRPISPIDIVGERENALGVCHQTRREFALFALAWRPRASITEVPRLAGQRFGELTGQKCRKWKSYLEAVFSSLLLGDPVHPVVSKMAGAIRQPIDIAALQRYIEQNVPQIQTPIEVKQVGDKLPIGEPVPYKAGIVRLRSIQPYISFDFPRWLEMCHAQEASGKAPFQDGAPGGPRI
jgi:hypothetical protein